jgi:hypothetical protein
MHFSLSIHFLNQNIWLLCCKQCLHDSTRREICGQAMLSILWIESERERKTEIMKKYFHWNWRVLIKVMVLKKILIRRDSSL